MRLASRRGELEAAARLCATVSEGELFMPFHYHEAAANRLTGAGVDLQAGAPALKISAVRLEKAGRRKE